MTIQKYKPVCGSCGAQVIWLSHDKTHKPAPIDTDPVPDGNITIDRRGGTYHVLSLTERGQASFFDTTTHELHKNHFATCPQAKSWHKAGKHG